MTYLNENLPEVWWVMLTLHHEELLLQILALCLHRLNYVLKRCAHHPNSPQQILQIHFRHFQPRMQVK